jgi:hypothetical protein
MRDGNGAASIVDEGRLAVFYPTEARGRIPHVTDPSRSLEMPEPMFVEYLVYKAHPALNVDCRVVRGDTGRFLTAVLQGVKTVVDR